MERKNMADDFLKKDKCKISGNKQVNKIKTNSLRKDNEV